MTSDATEVFDAETAPGKSRAGGAKKRPRLWLILIAIVVAIATLAGIAELALRAIIPNVIASAVRDNMHLSSDHPVEVDLGGSALFPALTGHVNNVTMRVPRVDVIEGIEADLFASADSVPFDPTKGDIQGAVASATIPSKNMDAVMSLVSEGFIDEGAVRDGGIELGRTMQIFGFDAHISATLAISIDNGDVLVNPISVRAAGFDLTAEQLRPLLGDAAAALLDTHKVCVRDRLPAGITLKNVDLRANALGGSATVTAALDPDILSNPAKLQVGSCAAE